MRFIVKKDENGNVEQSILFRDDGVVEVSRIENGETITVVNDPRKNSE